MAIALVPTRLYRRADSREAQQERHVAARSVVFPDALGVGLATVQARSVVLCDAHEGLCPNHPVEGNAQVVVHGLEVGAAMVDFVVLDYNEAREQSQSTDAVQGRVERSANLLL